MRSLALIFVAAAILSGCTSDRYDFDSRPADTSVRTPLKPDHTRPLGTWQPYRLLPVHPQTQQTITPKRPHAKPK